MRLLKYPNLNISFIILICIALISACKKPYDPPAIQAPNSYLVIEGVINSGNDSTIIKISRTVNLSQPTPNAVTGAVVTVEDNQNGSASLSEKTKGIYVAPNLAIDKTKQYRLRVKTSDNKVYLSAFVPVQTTPPIDSVGYTVQPTGMQLYVNAHDATSSVQYYRYEYAEAWQFQSFYYSDYEATPNGVEPRPMNQLIWNCFAQDTSSIITLASTSDLKQAVLYQNPVIFIPSTSEKIETRYSILVKQYALTADAYNFYTNLKKNTEQLGSIFDAQPSSIQGNIHCITNPTEPVIGFISVNNIISKRIFISKAQLPASWKVVYPSQCPLTTLVPDSTLYIFYAPLPHAFEVINKDADVSLPICVDCTLRGTRAAPSFWVY
jgi:hypothetical protein